LRVLTELGASSINCSSYRERAKRLGVRVGKGDVGTEFKREKTRSSGFDYQYEGAGAAPTDPRPLRWPGEPGIEAAIVGVLRNGATSVRITVRRDDSVSTDAELPLRLKKFGIELGIHGARSQVDTLEFVAAFPERVRQWRSR
jgi:hypothetical protein